MPERITQIAPAGGGISGGKIGVGGDTLWILPQIMRPSFVQRVIRATDEDDDEGPLVFVATREVEGTIQIAGNYETESGHIQNALGMFSETDSTYVIIVLDNGHTYRGYVLLLRNQTTWDKDAETVGVNVVLHFSGWIDGDGGGSDAYDSGVSGGSEAKVDLKEGASRLRGYQDAREDRATRPFIVMGVDEGTTSPLDDVIANVVTLTGGAEQTWKGDDTLKFRNVEAEWAGYQLVRGVLVYSRWLTDCLKENNKYSIGYMTRGYTAAIDSGNDSGGSDDVCDDLGGEGVTIQFIHRVKRPVPYDIVYIWGIWDENPSRLRDEMKGHVNSNTITIDGEDYLPYELRFDGIEFERTVTPAGNRYAGFAKFAVMPGGWIDGFLTCLKSVPLPLVGNQTLPGYTFASSVRTLYQYSTASFATLGELIPICYG